MRIHWCDVRPPRAEAFAPIAGLKRLSQSVVHDVCRYCPTVARHQSEFRKLAAELQAKGINPQRSCPVDAGAQSLNEPKDQAVG